jgi:tetratricopeptide (TPR) repeat protein
VLSDITKEMGELYYATHCALADSLATAALREPASAPRAIAAYGQLLEIPNLPREWLNQGRYKRAKLLEQIGQHGEAVTGYYELIKTPQGEQPEWFWYYKGGFDAANLLQTQKDWKSAVGIYEELARANGPRANEARQRSRELKLRNFVLE